MASWEPSIDRTCSRQEDEENENQESEDWSSPSLRYQTSATVSAVHMEHTGPDLRNFGADLGVITNDMLGRIPSTERFRLFDKFGGRYKITFRNRGQGHP
jgi:hypothetical protein